jgi:hypothetical protein
MAKWATGRFAELTFALAHRAKSQLVALGQRATGNNTTKTTHYSKKPQQKTQPFASFTAEGKVTFSPFSRSFINQLLIHGHTRYIIDP